MYQDEQKKRRLLQQLKNKQMMSQYEANKQRVQKGNLGDKIASGANAITDAYKTVNGIKHANQALAKFRTPNIDMDFAQRIGATDALKNMGKPMFELPASTNNFSLPTQNPALSTGNLSNTINAGSSLNGAGNAVNTASKVGNVASKASGALSKAGSAMPVVGTVAGLASAGSNFAQGKHVDGAMDLAKTGAMFIPGVGWAVAGAIQIAQMLKGMKDKKDQKAMAKAEEASQKEMQQSTTNLEANKQKMEQIKADQQQAMSEQLQKNNLDTSSNAGTDSLYEIGTNTPIEQQTPLKTDELGTEEGVMTGGASPVGQKPLPVDGSASQYLGQEQQYNDAVAKMPELPLLQVPQEEQQMAQAPTEADPKQGIWDLLNSKLGNVTEAVASIPGATSKMLDKVGLDHLANIPKAVSAGLNDFSAGYKDNTQTSFSQGDLAKRFQEPQEEAPKQLPDGTYDMKADEIKKSLMTRLGEMAGTGQRIASHPLTQAGIAGLVSKMAGGDVDDIAKAMYDYGTKKAEADRYYQMTTGKTDRPFLNTYGADDYKTQVQKDNWQKEFDWKVAQKERENKLAEDIHNAKLAQGGYSRFGSLAGDKLAWEQEKFKKNTMLKLLQDQQKQAIDALGDADYINVATGKKDIWGNPKTKPVLRSDKIKEINDMYNLQIRQLLNGEDVDLTAPPTTTQTWKQDEDGFYI